MLVLVRLEIVLILMLGTRFPSNVPQTQKLFCTHPIEHLGDVGHVESRFSLFGDSVNVGAR
jgi:hypothetical protein